MNQSNVISIPVAAATVFTQHLRVKVDSNGQAVLAGESEKGIGHALLPVNGPEGVLTCDIARSSAVGLMFAVSNAAIAKGQRVLAASGGEIAPLPDGIVTDDDDAATAGTDVLIAPLLDGVHAFLNSTNAGNADAVFQMGVGGGFVNVDDNDSPAGVVLYFDEDGGVDGEGKFLCVSPTGGDLLVPISNGTSLRAYHDAAAATNGVAVHFDDNGATASERILFVSPTNADGVIKSDDLTDNVSLAVAIESSGGDTEIIRIAYR